MIKPFVRAIRMIGELTFFNLPDATVSFLLDNLYLNSNFPLNTTTKLNEASLVELEPDRISSD